MDLLDELKAVDLTLEKWEKFGELIKSLHDLTSEQCGFCELYNCASDTCPAYKKCNELNVIYEAQYIIMEHNKKNISWLKKRRTMLKKKIKVKS